MFRNQRIQKIIASVVLTTFSSLLSYPMTAAAQAHDAMDKAGLLRKQKDEGVVGNAQRYFAKLTTGKEQKPMYKTNAEERMSQLLGQIHEHLKAVNPVPHASLAASPTATPGSMLRAKAVPQHVSTGLSESATSVHLTQIRAARSQMRELYADIAASFKETEQHIQDAKLPKEFLARHTAAVALYQSRQAQFDRLMDKVDQADIADIANVKQLQAANPLQSQQRSAQTNAPANPGKQRPAALAELSQFMNQYQNAKPHQFTDPNKLPFGSPSNKVRKPHDTKEQYQASLFPPRYDKILLAGAIPDGLKLAQATLPALPAAPDTAETEDVQITQAIKDKALALGGNPVTIYTWVRNNVKFIPSYGSIQGANMTLQNMQGNAFDIASLLIALYRSSGIPARYVYGTIDVPAERVMNWVGGATTPDAALSLLGQGGIPNMGIVSGGKISTIRMEHVWVNAFVDAFPSGGAKNIHPTTWLPVDASFKQYQFTSGMKVGEHVPLNSQSLLDQLNQGATVNSSEAWVKNLNGSAYLSGLTAYQNQVKTYIDSQKPNATIEDVLGDKKIIAENYSMLLKSLPYRTVVVANELTTLPDTLRHQFTLKLYNSAFDRDLGNAANEITISFPKLNSRRLSVTYLPTSPADELTLKSYRDNQDVNYIPPYLIMVTPQIKLDDEVIGAGLSVSMGQEQVWETNIVSPNDENAFSHQYSVTSGDQIVFGTDGNGINQEVIKQRANAVSPDSSLENLHQAALHYWTINDLFLNAEAKRLGVLAQRLPSTGLFASPLTVHYFFGIARQGYYQSHAMDISRLVTAVADGELSNRVSAMQRIGQIASKFESTTYEALFGLNPGTGNTTMDLLRVANDAGQKVYQIDDTNFASIAPKLALSAQILTDISNAVATGKRVTVHEAPVEHFGWTGAGYIIENPSTGEAYYLISGGTNGGELVECERKKEPKTVAIKEFLATLAFLAALAILIAVGGWIIGGGLIVGGGLTIAQVAVAFGLTGLTLQANAMGGTNPSPYPQGSKICGGSTCPNPTLYRSGNADNPRMDHVRIDRLPPYEDDIATYEVNGVVYVKMNAGGVSTSESLLGSNIWKFPSSEGNPNKVPIGLCIFHEPKRQGHWLWQPKVDMPLDAYQLLLKSSHPLFEKQ